MINIPEVTEELKSRILKGTANLKITEERVSLPIVLKIKVLQTFPKVVELSVSGVDISDTESPTLLDFGTYFVDNGGSLFIEGIPPWPIEIE